MSAGLKLTGLLLAGVLCLSTAGLADTQPAHRINKVKKQPLPPLPSGTQGPVPPIPLDAIPAVAPQVSFQDGLLTIVAPNSTLGDILRGVRKFTSAEIDIPSTASERVVTRLGPGPARVVMAELLNGSRFNYILLGSPQDANALVRVVLVAKVADTPNPPAPGAAAPPQIANAASDAPEETTDESADDPADQGTADAEQPAAQPSDQPAIKTPQQMLQEMQQRQLQMQQQQQSGQAVQPGQYPAMPGAPVIPRTPQQEQSQQEQQQPQ